MTNPIPTSVLLEQFSLYEKWVTENYITDPDLENAYRQVPGFESNFAGYVSIHARPLERFEINDVDILMSRPVADVLELQYRDYIHRVLTAQFSNIPNERLQEINLVSLGSDCLPRTLFTKWGLRRSRKFGERTLPFDLVSVGSRGTLRIIADDFRAMLDTSALTIAEGFDAPFNSELHLCFNHEVGPFWREDNHRRLVERYQKRIDRFRSTLRNGKPTIAVLNYGSTFDSAAQDALITAVETLSAKTAGRLRFLCVITAPSASEWRRTYAERVTSTATLTRVYNERPVEMYQFYRPDLYTSPDGVRYERGFLEAIRDVIEIESGIRVSLGEPPPVSCPDETVAA